MTTTMPIKALAPWFGANRVRAALVGESIGRVAWCAVPFMGGGAELPWIDTAEGVASDRHSHVINLARVVRDVSLKDRLVQRLETTLFHERELRDAQARCRERELLGGDCLWARECKPDLGPDLDWAFDYFIACWMAPGATAGKGNHFEAYFPVRFSSSGGGSAKRFRSAVQGLDAWCQALGNWTFLVADAREILDRMDAKQADRADPKSVKRPDAWGCYCDPPWPEAGREYAHQVADESFHRDLEARLRRLTTIRVVVRYGDHPMIRELYRDWRAVEHETRTQARTACPELLLTNAPFREVVR